MKHPATSRWNVAKTSQWDISTTSYWNVMTTPQEDVTTTSHQCVSSTSQKSLKWNTQRRLSGTSPRRVSGTYLWRPISTSLRLLLKSQMKHLIEHHCGTSPPRLRVTLLQRLVNRSLLHFQVTLCTKLLFKLLVFFNLVGFHVLFKYQIKEQNVLLPIRRETRRVGL